MSQPKTSLTKELSHFSKTVDWLYDRCTVPFFVAVLVLYVAPLGDWRAYIIVPLTCFLIPLLCTKFLLFCHRHGFLRYMYDTVHAFVSGAFIKIWLGVNVLRQSKPGQIFLWLALINVTYFGGYWCYVNVDLLKLGRSLWHMIYTMVTSLRDPVAIMLTFQETLRTMSVYRTMEYIRVVYVNDTVHAIDGGSASIFFPVVIVTAALTLGATFFYFFPNVVWPPLSSALGWEKGQQVAEHKNSPLAEHGATSTLK
jgi:hypothetical protein